MICSIFNSTPPSKLTHLLMTDPPLFRRLLEQHFKVPVSKKTYRHCDLRFDDYYYDRRSLHVQVVLNPNPTIQLLCDLRESSFKVTVTKWSESLELFELHCGFEAYLHQPLIEILTEAPTDIPLDPFKQGKIWKLRAILDQEHTPLDIPSLDGFYQTIVRYLSRPHRKRTYPLHTQIGFPDRYH